MLRVQNAKSVSPFCLTWTVTVRHVTGLLDGTGRSVAGADSSFGTCSFCDLVFLASKLVT